MSFAAIGGIVAAGAGVYGAVSSRKAGKQARSDAMASREAQAGELAAQQEALAGLFGEMGEMPNPAEVFREMLLSMPELLQQVLPQLRDQSKETAEDFTRSNLNTFDIAIKNLFPQYAKYQSERVRMMDQLNPENLGRDEILGVSRKLAPLLPEGTFDPKTGGVQGGTQNAVSLYRNLVSGMYQERRNQYMGEVKSYLGDAENSAIRQQERASSFLPMFLSMASNSASQLTDQTLKQNQWQIGSQIDAQSQFLNTLLGMPMAGFDSAPYDQGTSQGIQAAISGLSAAGGAFSKRPQSNAYGSNPTFAYQPTGNSVGKTPPGLTSYAKL